MRRIAAAIAASSALALPSAAAAERPPAGSGIAGGALLGAELTLLVETAFNVEPLWAYVLGGVLGASAGAFAGYAAERNADPDVALYGYAAGLALVVPTMVWLGRAHTPEPPPVPLRPDDTRRGQSSAALGAPALSPPPSVALSLGAPRTLPSLGDVIVRRAQAQPAPSHEIYLRPSSAAF